MPPEGPAALGTTTLVVSLAVAVVAVTIVVAVLLVRRARAATLVAERRAAKERERADLLEKELHAAAQRVQPDARVEKLALDGLERALRELAACATREDVSRALGRAVVESAVPRQWMVFLAADDAGRDFVVSASGSADGAAVWEPGARLTPDTGKVGLAIRRRATLDRHDFESEPPIVRDQVVKTEPADFKLDVVTPVLVGDRVVAVLAVGGPEVLLGVARTSLDVLASFATVVLRGLAAKERAERFANQDTLTGVANKSWFNASGAEAIYRIRQDGGTASVLALGIDAYARYVRRQGHAAADRLVRGVAQVIRPLVGETDILARWNGDEFVVLLPGTDPVLAWKLAADIRRAVSAVDWPHAGDQPGGRVTICAGIASCPASGDTLEAVVEAAVRALADARAANGSTTGSVVVDRAAAADSTQAREPAAAAGGAPGELPLRRKVDVDEVPSVVEEEIPRRVRA